MQLTSTDLSPYPSLDERELPWVHWWDAASRQHEKLNSCAMPSAPTSNAKEGSKDQARWGTEKPTAFLCAFPGHAMAWKGTGERALVQWDKAGGRGQCFSAGMSQWLARREKTGSRTVFVLRSGEKGWGKTKAHGCDPFSFCTAETPWASISFAFSQAKGKHKYMWKQDLGSGLSCMQDLALSTG